MRRTVGLIMSLIIIVCFAGCNRRAERIEVFSPDFPNLRKLTACEFDSDKNEKYYSGDSSYLPFLSCRIEKKGASIIVRKTRENEGYTHIILLDYGYFIGVNIGEFDGWVRFYPYNSACFGLESTLVVNENCLGFIKISNQKGYLVTEDYRSMSPFNCFGHLFELNADYDSGTVKWEKIAETDTAPFAFTYDEETESVYMATCTSIIMIDKNHTGKIVKETEMPFEILINSMIKIGNSLFCGSFTGIYEYRIDSDEEFWYPFDFDKDFR